MSTPLSKVKAHLRNDPTLAPLLAHLDALPVVSSVNPFLDLIEAIVNQQLSEKAGATIFSRFRASFPGGHLDPSSILSRSDESLRSVGVSWSKVRYIKALASSVEQGTLRLEDLPSKTDEAVIAELTKITGIGRWTAEMFLMFSLGREDVFSYGDLGLRRAIQSLYGMKREPTVRQMERIVTKWRPYRTYGAKLLWKSLSL